MDKSELKYLIEDASSRGIVDRRIVEEIGEEFRCDSGVTPTASLLHMYTRRLKRTTEGSDLHTRTANLVAFLREYPGDSLSMISVRPADGGGLLLFLADPEENKILHHMQMFGLPDAT